MRNLLQNLVIFIKSLSLVDVLFFASIIILLILIVSLVYITRMNNDVEEEVDMNDNDIDLVDISKKIGEESMGPIKLTDYEKEQEDKAIISYDELLKTKTNIFEEVNYKKEKDLEGLKVRELDTTNTTKKVEMPKMKEDNKTNSVDYAKEEAFLETLKKLQRDLD